MNGNIPVLQVEGRSLPEAWERALLSLWQNGCRVRTQYDRKGSGGEFIDPPSVDATMMVTVLEPDSEPRFHKCFPGGPADLQEYRMEVLKGIKDHWVDLHDKAKWQYTYHERLTKYDIKSGSGGTGMRRDQIAKVIEQLAEIPYSRRIQAITWQPWHDQDSSDPPCLQRLWFRILEDDDGTWRLNMNVSFRSRDGYMAAFMNMDAFIELMRGVAAAVGLRAGRPVGLGRYCDVSDSFHIYGKDIERFEREFLVPTGSRVFYDEDPTRSRTARTEDWSEMMLEAISEIHEKIRRKDAGE